MAEHKSPEDFGPVAQKVAGTVNRARFKTDAEMQIAVHGNVVENPQRTGLEYAVTLAAAAAESAMLLAHEVDELKAKVAELEAGSTGS